jgi:hypothetical protein
VQKLGTYWVGDPNADWNNEQVFNYRALCRIGFKREGALAIMAARALPIVALAGVFVLWSERRRLMPVNAILLYCTFLHAATHAEARLSEPFQPLLLIVVAGAIGALWERRSARPAVLDVKNR